MMKRIAALLAVAGLGLIGLGISAGPASATKPSEDPVGIELPNGTHIKVDICHWANGHPHIVPVSADAVTTVQDAKHGNLQIDANVHFVSFVPHDTNGHEEDWVARIYLKKGNDETNTYVSERECGEEETTTTTEPPTTTTTTTELPVTTTTTEPPVVTTTTTQPTVVVTTLDTPVTDTPAPDAPVVVVATPDAPAPAAPAPATPVAGAPAGELASTGSWAQMLALIGAGVGLLGLSLLLGFRRNGAVS